MKARAALLLAALALAGCRSSRVCTPVGGIAAAPPPPDWREAATDADHVKLRKSRTLFIDGLAQARAAGFAAPIAAGGALYDPDAAQEGVALPPGGYRCRTTTLGSKAAGRPAFVAEPARGCRIVPAGAIQRFVDDGGPQRLVGRVYPDTPARAIFLGTVALADEATALHYARDDDRDRAGMIERIGPRRWRMTMPDPAWGGLVDLVEIVPEG